MTLGAFVDRALRIKGNRLAIIEDTDRPALLKEGSAALREYSGMLRSLWTPGTDFSYPAGAGGLALPDLEPRDVFLLESGNVRAIADLDGRRGATSEYALSERASELLNGSGSPRVWTVVPPESIRLYPAPSAPVRLRISGWRRHAPVALEGDALELAEGDVEAAARWMAARLLADSEDAAAREFGAAKAAEARGWAESRNPETVRRMGARRARGRAALDRVRVRIG